jgi:formiminoglutamase
MTQLWHDARWPRASAWLAGEHALEVCGKLAVIGAPLTLGSITPGRCDLAPAAVRAALARFSTYDLDHDIDLHRLAVQDHADSDVAHLHPEDAFMKLVEDIGRASQGMNAAVVLGGDNSITRPGVHALGIPLSRCGLLTLDAHFDLRDLDSGLRNGNPVRALLADGLPGHNIVQIGLQPFANSAAYTQVARDAGIQFYTAAQVRRCGLTSILQSALRDLDARTDAIYFDLDVDVLDRAASLATPGARPGGLQPWEILEAARICGAHPKVRIMDLVEIDPEKDMADVTALTAASCFLSFASGLISRLQPK